MHGVKPEPPDMHTETGLLGSNQSGMRRQNERLVLSLIRKHGALPKAEIARMTGLSAQTITVIIRELERDGLLERGEKLRGKIGQPSVPMQLVADGALFFGLKVGRRSADLILVNFKGEIKARVHTTYQFPKPQDTLAFVRTSLAQIEKDLDPAARQRIAGLGIAMPFFIWNWATEIGVDEAEMEAWKNVDLRAEVAAMVEYPVYLGNDATSACGAELMFGAGGGPADFLYVFVGYFIGGGIVLNGSLYTGPTGNAGALGPLPVAKPAYPGQQLVDVASLIGLEKRMVEAGGTANMIWENPNTWDIPDEHIDAWFSEVAPELAHAAVCALSFIDFSAVIIDGWFPERVRTKLVERVEDAFGRMNLSGLNRPEFRAGTVGPEARSLGAASLPLSKRFMHQN